MNAHELLQVQRYEAVGGQTGQVRLLSETPYLRLCFGNNPPLFAKQGGIYSAAGNSIDKVPDWFWDQARKMSPEARALVNLRLPEEGDAPDTAAAGVSATPPVVLSTWTCPDCSKTMALRARGVHVAAHNRTKRRKIDVAGSV